MQLIKETIENLMHNWERKKKYSSHEDPEVWLKEVLAKKELGHVKFHYFRKGTLGIQVDSSSWLYQLGLKKEALLAKLRKKSPKLQDVRFYLGEIK
jgi:predicted nucleic acid-binding Zn ribbon protein